MNRYDPAPELPTDPIRKTLTVPLPPDDAFDLFTARIDRWWPLDTHSISARDGTSADASVRIEPRVGGRVLETLSDGATIPWATVTRWEPGRHLALSWYVGRDEDEATQIDVVFTGTEAGTRVDLTHAGFDTLGSSAPAACATYTSGWDHVLATCYAGACHAVHA